jgi:probable blue pigment (indigoidine) exporter
MPVLNFTVRQLSAGGLILLPIAIIADPPVSHLTATNLLGLA